jgi:predicted ribosome quality control (RQC) complex YloA/Tae2 family protein
VIRCENDAPAPDTLLLAASLAAYFSKANHSSKVPVDYTPCRYVKKPTGAKPGFVIFTNQKTLYVTPNEQEMALLILQDLNKK